MKRPFRSERSAGESAGAGERQGAPESAPKLKRIGPKTLRIIGGDLRRRNVTYNGDRLTRPMKDNVRENLFNILGKGIEGTVAYDLFAGTGILAIEAISRGARHAIAVDSSRDSVRSIRQSLDKLQLHDRVEVLLGDTFRLSPMRLDYAPGERRVVFCCPPYAMWESHGEPLNQLIVTAAKNAAEGSLIVAEMDRKSDPAQLPSGEWLVGEWDVRTYGNTHLAVAEVGLLPEVEERSPSRDGFL